MPMGANLQLIHSASAVDQLVQYQFLRRVPDTVHSPYPLHLIVGLQRLGHALVRRHPLYQSVDALQAGTVDIQQVLVQGLFSSIPV